MKLCRILFSLALVFAVSAAHAQDTKMVLFETFTNSVDGCPASNDFDAAFRQTMSGSNANSAKTIHLNYHTINLADPMASASSPSAQNTLILLSGVQAQPFPTMCAAVDRTNFPPNDKLTGTIPGGKTQWDQRITDRVKLAPSVSIKLISAMIDDISSDASARFIAKIDVTSNQATPDTMSIHYAITEDNVPFAQCPDTKPPGPTHHNDVVRYVTVGDSLLDLRGKPAGTVTHVTYVQNISKTIKNMVISHMKLVAFVQDHKDGDFQVVQAGILQTDLLDLPAPPASITLNSAILDGMTFSPFDLITILFDKVSVATVKIEYSSDGGTTWQYVDTTRATSYYFSAPDKETDLARIRISDVSNPDISVIEKKVFKIKQAPYSLNILHPSDTDIVYIGQKYTITWSSHNVDTVSIDYYDTLWHTLAVNLVGKNSYVWSVMQGRGINYFPTNSAQIKIRPNIAEYTTPSTSLPFRVLNANGGGVHSSVPDASFSVSVNPQPARRSEPLKVNLTLDGYAGVDLSLYDLAGKKILSKERAYFSAGNSTVPFELNSLAAGSYILEARRDDGVVRTMK
ncbi:MAG: hypothetical protein Q8919_13080, partial [Bacteroidota bacterium]|nr:hypothetical protein [Bacteroidota bacterium]